MERIKTFIHKILCVVLVDYNAPDDEVEEYTQEDSSSGGVIDRLVHRIHWD